MIEFIVSGIARSGTTALAKALNMHPRIFCSIEHLRPLDNHRDRFRPDRLLDDGHPGHLSANKAILAQKGALVAIGNKHPGYFVRWDGVLNELTNGKAIFILREPQAIMASWNSRAANSNGRWPEAQTGAFAMLDMIEALRQIHASSHIRSTLYVSYEALFFGDRCRTVFEQLLKFLDAETETDVTQMFSEQLTNRETIAQHTKSINEDEVALAEALSIAPLLNAVHSKGAVLGSNVHAEAQEIIRLIDGTAPDLIRRFHGLFRDKPRYLRRYVKRRNHFDESVLFRALANLKKKDA